MPKFKKRIINLLFIVGILAFFITPLGYESKILLNRLFATSPKPLSVIKEPVEYDWRLKDSEWNFFNFEKSKKKVVFVGFWASWRIPAIAELRGIQKLYDDYKGRVDFYIITNEERKPVETLMRKRGYHFPVTYLIIGEKMPFDAEKVPSGYLIDKKGRVVMQHEGVANWNSAGVRKLIDKLLAESED